MLKSLTHAVLGSALAIIPAAALTTPASPQAGHTLHNEVVTLSEWSDRLNVMLDDELRSPRPMLGRALRPGTVRVKFNCSEDGRPANVELLRGSGDTLLDREAVRAVGALASMHPLPTGFAPDQAYEAILVFARNANDPMLKKIRVEQSERNAWYRDPDRPGTFGTEIISR